MKKVVDDWWVKEKTDDYMEAVQLQLDNPDDINRPEPGKIVIQLGISARAFLKVSFDDNTPHYTIKEVLRLGIERKLREIIA